KVRGAITRAILFASENTKQAKTDVRRVLRLRKNEDALKLIADAPAEAPSRVMVNDTLMTELFDTNADQPRLKATTRQPDIAKLIDAGLFQQGKLDLPTSLIGPANEIIRSLLPNLI